MRIDTECALCGKQLVRYTKHSLYFCNQKHKGAYQKEHGTTKGKNNPNFGNRWNDEQREHAAKVTSARMTPERRAIIGDQHRGKIATHETRQKMSESRTGKSGQSPTPETREKIGKASAAKFTEEYKKKIRANLEASGAIIPLNEIDDYKLYKKFADWCQRMYDFVTNEAQLDMLASNGVYNSYTNLCGVVRDHVYSRRSGFDEKVFPELLRHPCNLQLLTQSENVRKRHGYRDCDGQSRVCLFENIRQFCGDWFEQEICVELILRYECGERYEKSDYIAKYYR